MRTDCMGRSIGMVLALCAFLSLAGCQSSSRETPFLAPPQPVAGATISDPFFVVTSDYSTLYTPDTAPFDERYQFANGHYPLQVAYAGASTLANGFDVAQSSEDGFVAWAQADPRVCIVSGAPPGEARIRIALVEQIVYQGITNILGLTQVSSGVRPGFDVSIATLDPANGQPMTAEEMRKVITHEIGHTLGLGHSPNQYDLMYYRSNTHQGNSYQTFLTLGDALAIWDTLNIQRVNWVQARPTVAHFTAPFTITRARIPVARISDADGRVVCVYQRP